MAYPIEEIPDNNLLFYRIHIVNIDTSETDKKKKIKPVAFDPQPKPTSTQMSVDWSKYSSALDTQNRAKIPEKNGVLSFNSTQVREAPQPLEVRHSPSTNQAHSLIYDIPPEKNNPEIRIKLRRICDWAIEI